MKSSKNSSKSSDQKSVGNTKPQISPAVKWCFTLNNYSNDDIKEINLICSKSSKYYIFGLEVGEKGTPHLQGYIEFKKKCRPFNVFDNKNFHWEKAKGNRESNYAYCSKSGHFWINGIEQEELELITTLRPWQKIVYEFVKQKRSRIIHWVYETTGNVGKTELLRYIVANHKDCLVLCGKANDMKNGVLQFHKTHGFYPKTVVFNLPRSFNTDHLSLSGIEEIKDGLFYCGKYEGGTVVMNKPNMIIMSNTPFDDVVTDDISPNRWNVVNIDDLINKKETVENYFGCPGGISL